MTRIGPGTRRRSAVGIASVWFFALAGIGVPLAAAAQDPGAELVEALETRCLPLIAGGGLETATLSEVPSFVAANFFDLLGVEGRMYQLSPSGEVRIVVPEDGAVCVAYVQAQEPGAVIEALEAWRAGAGNAGALPDVGAGQTEGAIRAGAAEVAIRLDPDRLYLILTVTGGA